MCNSWGYPQVTKWIAGLIFRYSMANRSRRKSFRRNKRSRRNRRGGEIKNRNNLINYLKLLRTEDDLRERLIRACAIINYMTATPSLEMEEDLRVLRRDYRITSADIYSKNMELDDTEVDQSNIYNEEANVLVRAYNGEVIDGNVTPGS
jgi:hypothetical protein